MAQLKHIREASDRIRKLTGYRPIIEAHKGHFKFLVNGKRFPVAGSPSDVRSMKNCVAQIVRSVR